MPRFITILGVVTSVAFIVAPELTEIDPTLSRYLIIVGVVAAAIGRALVGDDDPRFRRALALLIIPALVVSQVGCDQTKTLKSVADEVAALLESADTLIVARRDAGAVTPDEADALRAKFRGLASGFRALNVEVQRIEQLDADSALRLLPAAEDFVRVLDAENVINLSNLTERKRFAEAHAVLRILAGRIVAHLRKKAPRTADVEDFRRDTDRLRALLAV